MMLDYSALASAVVLKAHDDLFGENLVWETKAKNRREKWRKDAREFLTVANEDLKFWCVVGGLHMGAIVESTNKRVKEVEIEAAKPVEVKL